MSVRVADPGRVLLVESLNNMAEKTPWAKADTAWMEHGGCRRKPPAWWDLDSAVSGKVDPSQAPRVEQAKEICYVCPVRIACFNFAIKFGVRTGIWGGYDPGQRHGYNIAVAAKRNARKRLEEAACTN